MYTDLRGSNPKTVPIVLNQIVILRFQRHPRSIVLDFHYNINIVFSRQIDDIGDISPGACHVTSR